MSRLTRDGTAEPVSRDQILGREREKVKKHFPCSADHEQDWQPYPVDPYSCSICDHACIHTYIHISGGVTFNVLSLVRNNRLVFAALLLLSSTQHTPPVLSACRLHTNSGCGKERRILTGPW